MSLVTPSPGQQWVHNRTQTPVLIDSIHGPGLTPSARHIIIYRDRDGHVPMDLDRFVHEYYFAAEHAPSPEPVADLRGASKEFYDVFAFHEKFGLINHVNPGHLTKAKLQERVEFMLEELLEFATAAGIAVDVSAQRALDGVCIAHETSVSDGSTGQSLAGQADALVDLVYVALGTAVMLGLPWDPLWDDVQRANMAKVRGVTHRGHAVDVKKPEGWVGPQTQAILDLAGYQAHEEYRDDTERQAL